MKFASPPRSENPILRCVVALFFLVFSTMQSAADSMEGMGEIRTKLNLFKTLFGEDFNVSPTGEVSFTWRNPNTHELKEIIMLQRNALGVPEDVQLLTAGKSATCIILLEVETLTYADCRIFLNGVGNGSVLLLDLILESNPDLIGCRESERSAFERNGKQSCFLWE